MSGLVRGANEKGSRARADRFVGQGRVVSVDKVKHTCRVSVGATDCQGNDVFLEDVAYQPQSPPSPGDGVTLAYANASPHSLYIAGGRLSGSNQQSTITTVGGVSSISTSGNPKASGDITNAAGSGIAITQAGQTFTWSCTVTPGMVVEIDGAMATAAPRTTLDLQTGQGMHLDITDDPTHNRVAVKFNSLFGTITPTKITSTASPYSVPAGDFTIFCDTSSAAISVVLPAPAANNGRLIVLMNTGANAVNVTSAAGSVVGISTITHSSGATAVWYISDGVNWYSMTNSAGN